MLRGVLQNGQSRQALAILLLLPLLLRSSRLLALPWGLIVGSSGLSAMSHTTFPINLSFALLPALLSAQGRRFSWRLPLQRRLWLAAAAASSQLALLLGAPMALEKLNTYSTQVGFFSHYPVRREVLLLEAAMALARIGRAHV